MDFHFTEDILRQQEGINSPRNFTEFIFNESLILIEDKIQDLGGQDLPQFGLPPTDRENRNVRTDVLRESSYDMNELKSFIEENEPRLTKEQRNVYERISSATGGQLFFVEACGGTGKTFLLSLLHPASQQLFCLGAKRPILPLKSLLNLLNRPDHSAISKRGQIEGNC